VPPRPGEEIVILGYPLGLAGVLVRANPQLLEQSTANGQADFWSVARRLAEASLIKPLASRGIVSQITNEVIVYDAETTIGGSGGPVMNLSGQVIAINRAILKEFGGSNMGVPAARALELLEY